MKNIDSKEVLKLNSSWEPIGFMTTRKVFGDMAVHKKDRQGHLLYDAANRPRRIVKPMDIEYEQNEDGSYDFSKIKNMTLVDWEDWIDLPVRSYDAYISTAKKKIRVPRVVVSQSYSGMPKKKAILSLSSIYELYGHRCAYTNKLLSRSEATMDHYVPRARGGTHEFENVVLCDSAINSKKGSKLNSEAGLPEVKPIVPTKRRVCELIRNTKGIPEWDIFIYVKTTDDVYGAVD